MSQTYLRLKNRIFERLGLLFKVLLLSCPCHASALRPCQGTAAFGDGRPLA